MEVRVGVDGGFLSSGGFISPGVNAALPQLLWAREYAAALHSDPWQFAVELDELARSGLTRTDLRWLLAGGLIEHREETTAPNAAARTFRPLTPASVPPRTCLLLTDVGCRVLSPLAAMQVMTHGASALLGMRVDPPTPSAPLTGGSQTPAAAPPLPTVLPPGTPHALAHASRPAIAISPPTHLGTSLTVSREASSPGGVLTNGSPGDRPAWDQHLRELWLGERLVKRFRVPADNQEVILTTFEEDGWPDWIDDPLPPARDLDPKRRLQATIKSLNRNQLAPVLRFHGNGGGDVVYWSVT